MANYKDRDCEKCLETFKPCSPSQKVCSKTECQKERRSDNAKKWRSKGREYEASRPEVKMKNKFLLRAA